jgi:hypothetical protein
MEERLNRIAWNGRFYTHWVPEDPDFRPDLGVDMSSQVSLSNAYTLNRGIAPQQARRHHPRATKAIRKEMPETSPGEFYSIYPPVQEGLWRRRKSMGLRERRRAGVHRRRAGARLLPARIRTIWSGHSEARS